MRKNITIKRILLASVLISLPISNNLVCGAEASSSSEQRMVGSHFAQIKQILDDHKDPVEKVRGKDVTVILGNTGVGKSTLINFLAGVPMEVDFDGHFIPEHGKQRVKVRAGFAACTKFPELVEKTRLGDLCDLPGFQDTEGAVDDLLNAGYIRQALLGANTVRALFMTSEDEITAVKGDALKKLAIFMKMFKKPTFISSSCYLLVNKVDRGKIAQRRTDRLFEGIFDRDNTQILKELKDTGKIFFIPASRAPENTEDAERERDKILSVYEDMIRAINTVSGSKLTEGDLEIGLSLNIETKVKVKGFIQELLYYHLNQMVADEYSKVKVILLDAAKAGKITGKASAELKSMDSELLESFKNRFRSSTEYQLLQPICGDIMNDAISKFDSELQKTHNQQVQELIIIEEKEAKEAAEAARLLAEEASKKAAAEKIIAEENEAKANLAKQEAERLAAEQEAIAKAKTEETRAAKEAEIAAIEKERIAKEAAAQAQNDASLSAAQKLEAQNKALDAEKAALAAQKESLKLAADRDKAELAAQHARVEQIRAAEEAERTKKEMLAAQKSSEEKMIEFQKKAEEAQKKNEEMQKAFEKRMADMEIQRQQREAESARVTAQLQEEIKKAADDGRVAKEEAEKQFREYQERQQRLMQEQADRQERERQAWAEKLEVQQAKMEQDRQSLRREMEESVSRARAEAEAAAAKQSSGNVDLEAIMALLAQNQQQQVVQHVPVYYHWPFY